MSAPDRLAEIREKLGRMRTPQPGTSPPRTLEGATAYLQRLGDFMPGFLADVDWLVGEVERLRLIYYMPTGDNHHNAALCPYCSPNRPELSP